MTSREICRPAGLGVLIPSELRPEEISYSSLNFETILTFNGPPGNSTISTLMKQPSVQLGFTLTTILNTYVLFLKTTPPTQIPKKPEQFASIQRTKSSPSGKGRRLRVSRAIVKPRAP